MGRAGRGGRVGGRVRQVACRGPGQAGRGLRLLYNDFTNRFCDFTVSWFQFICILQVFHCLFVDSAVILHFFNVISELFLQLFGPDGPGLQLFGPDGPGRSGRADRVPGKAGRGSGAWSGGSRVAGRGSRVARPAAPSPFSLYF